MEVFILPGFGAPSPPPVQKTDDLAAGLARLQAQLAEFAAIQEPIRVDPVPSTANILGDYQAIFQALVEGIEVPDIRVYPTSIRITVYEAEWTNDTVVLGADGAPVNLFPSEFTIMVDHPNEEHGWGEMNNSVRNAIIKAYPEGGLASWRWTMRAR